MTLVEGIEMAACKLTDLARKTIDEFTDDELHYICTRINEFYDDFDYDNYERWLDVLTSNIHEYNWLEDLCTDLRMLGSWEKC